MIYVFCTSLLYLILIAVIYFSKNKLKSFDNRVYGFALVVTIIEVMIDIMQVYFASIGASVLFLSNLNKVFLFSVATWITVFTIYVVGIENNIINIVKIKKIIFLLLLVAVAIFILPVDYHFNKNGMPYIGGPVAFCVYFYAGLLITIIFGNLIKQLRINKVVSRGRFIPILIFLTLGFISLIIQFFNPDFLLTSPVESFIVVLIYFFIENPDVKMLNEFQKNKDYAIRINEEKSMFLYDITQDMRKPLNQIEGVCKDLIAKVNDKEIGESVSFIDSRCKNMLCVINNVLDVSNMDACNIKIYDTKYNPHRLMEEIIKLTRNNVKEGVEFRTNIDGNLPNLLFGDSLRIKQVLKVLLDNSCNYTSEGFVELTAHEIIKNDVCRLIIKVEDSGGGISTDQLDKIFSRKEEEGLDQDISGKTSLKTAKAVVNLLGGLLMFNSELGKGSKFTLILDQKIVEDKSKELKKIEILTRRYISLPKMAVVSEDSIYSESSIKKLRKIGLNAIGIDLGAKIIENVRNKEKYDYILLDENLSILSASNVITKLLDLGFDRNNIYILSSNSLESSYEKTGIKIIQRKLKANEIREILNKKRA